MGQIVTISDLQREGFTGSQYDGSRLTPIIEQVERVITAITGRTFYKTDDYTEVVVGRGTAVIRLHDPVLSIDSIADSDGTAIDLTTVVKVETLNPESYLRTPRLRLTDGSTWTRDVSYSVTGSFGFAFPDGENWRPPDMIKRAAIMLVARWAERLVDRVPADELVKSESKGNFSYTLADNAISQGATGDSEIDGILASYRRYRAVAV